MIAVWRRLPWGLLGMLALVACVERSLARHALDFTRPEGYDWGTAGKAARRKTQGREILVFGTSMTQQGLLPSALRERTGSQAYNLSICAGPAPAAYFLLKRALDSGASPEAVLVDFHPFFLSGCDRSASSSWPDMLEPREALDMAWTLRDASFFASTVLGHAMPSVGNRLQIRKAIAGALRGESSSLRYYNVLFAHNKKQNEGSLVHRRKPDYRGEVTPNLSKIFLPASWAVDDLNARYLRRFVALAGSRGIEVYWVIPPLAPELQARRDRSGLEEPYDRFIRSVQAEHANLVVLDARKSGYQVDVFTDAAHLDLQGALAWSTAVGDVLAARKGRPAETPRWVKLPPYREGGAVPPMFDLDDSDLALRKMSNPRR